MCCKFNIIASSIVLITFLEMTSPKVINVDYKRNYSIWLREYHTFVVNNYMKKRENWTTSVLGDIMFKLKTPQIERGRQNKTFQIYLWKFWNYYESRSFLHFGIKKTNPVTNCSVKNCEFHSNPYRMKKSDAVVVWLGNWPNTPRLPSISLRYLSSINQKWIFYTEESPVHTGVTVVDKPFWKIANNFNWAMTYRTDADIPIPYGRTLPLKEPKKISSIKSISKLVPDWSKKQKNVLVANMMSNCYVKYRSELIRSLQKYIPVDFYGKCGDWNLRKKCPGHFESDCKYLSHYYFYLALENSLCRQYITEKVFHNGYLKGTIPIIKGAPVADCEKLLPPHSFLHVDNYPSLEALADEIVEISQNENKLLSYHVWRAHFEVTSEAGFFGTKSKTLCRICEALNYNSLANSRYKEDDMQLFLDKKLVCDLSIDPKVDPIAPPVWCYDVGKEHCIEL